MASIIYSCQIQEATPLASEAEIVDTFYTAVPRQAAGTTVEEGTTILIVADPVQRVKQVLVKHRAQKQLPTRSDRADLSSSRHIAECERGDQVYATGARLPGGPSAAVLVPLFVGQSGDLRSDALKTFAGDTVLPGGKIDAQDVTMEDTAVSFGLPQDKERVPLSGVMELHLAKGEILVTPCVCVASVLRIDLVFVRSQPNLNFSEVTSIFAQPLISFFSSTPYLSGGRTSDPKNPYHTFMYLPWSDGGAFRLHKFLTGREGEGVKPVFGLTASILIKTATIGYGYQLEFEAQPPNAPTPAQQIACALLTPANPIRIAC
ncbi:hypothetical protein J3R83DRAFT_1347 [Lanmaoa asiatica]|nr:hypothetical protein J3R83DRAFT_1347 [Lanmaoa asiatica]